MDYQDYSSEDFVLDPNFRKWVLGVAKDTNGFWENWISEHPDKLDVIKEARRLVLNIGEIKYSMSEKKVENIWNEIGKYIDQKRSSEEPETKTISISPKAVIYASERKVQKNKTSRFLYWWRVVAAAVVFAMALSYFFLRDEFADPPATQQAKQIVKSNPFGQKSTIYLSDGSEVILNSGSSLSYGGDFGVKDRNIKLTGEAYFKVAEDRSKPFIVVSKGVETMAMGTEFNVRAYDDEVVSVALTKGKVRVISKTELNKLTGESVILAPGEGVKYNDDNTLSKFNFDHKEFTAWTTGTLYFKNASEQQVLRKLEKWYGVNFEIKNKSPKKWGYTGEFDKKSLESVMMSIGFAMDFSFEIKSDTVLLKYNTNENRQ